MDHLWAPWRHPYVTGSEPRTDAPGCVFCAAPNEPAELSLVVYRGTKNYVILNRYPYNVGHLMVLPYRHVPSLVDLSAAELHELADLTQRAEQVLTGLFEPSGINVGINLGLAAGAGLRDHLHLHLVPRWSGDHSFITVVGETRVLTEELPATALRLRAAWTSR
jgi:ATP adenylyltransferase